MMRFDHSKSVNVLGDLIYKNVETCLKLSYMIWNTLDTI
jgi:hypothetical protein